jgi:hypothetical protein
VTRFSENPEQTALAQATPTLIFSTELEGADLYRLLTEDDTIDELDNQRYGVALALMNLSEAQAHAVRLLNSRGIYTVAWMLLPPGEGCWFNLQNYPQAIERYHAFRDWMWEHNLHFDAVGIDIEPPVSEFARMPHWRLRDVARRFWLARENVLYPAARSAYKDLIAEIHRDGYEVHIYQLPLIGDDRRVGTTLIQRALDVVDLPADLEVLMCYSSLPIADLNNDIGGALITSYGPGADSIGIGSTSSHTLLNNAASASGAGEFGTRVPPLTWEGLERDLLLAARYTDTMYVFSLEGCVEQRMLHGIASLDWDRAPAQPWRGRLLVAVLRTLLLLVLLVGRFYRAMFAWSGWILVLVLLLRRRRAARNKPTRM